MGAVFLNFMYIMCNAERKASANPRHTLYKMIFMAFMTKWIFDVYDLTQ